jgi:WD40 repeat protein
MKVTSPDYPSLPYLAHTLASSPPVYVYSAVFQENIPSSSSEKMPFGFQASSNADLIASIDSRGSRASLRDTNIERAPPPRVINGASDGRLRVYEGSNLKGKIRVDNVPQEGSFEEDFAPHDGRINVVAIDERTRYLMSGDSAGDILVWRLDSHGWYELLRKFKRETSTPNDMLGTKANLGMILCIRIIV